MGEDQSAHTNTDAAEVEESGSILDTNVEEVDTEPTETETLETQDENLFELPEQYRDNPAFEGIDSGEALYARIAEKKAPEEYQLPEGLDESLGKAIVENAKAVDMSQEHVDTMLQLKADMDKAAETSMWAEVNKGVEALKGEWGQEFETKVGAANKAIRAFDKDGSIRKMMQQNPVIANHPDVVKMFHSIHEAIDIDRFIDSEGQPKTKPKDENGQPYLSSYDKSMR